MAQKPGTWKAGQQGSINNVTVTDLIKEKAVIAAFPKIKYIFEIACFAKDQIAENKISTIQENSNMKKISFFVFFLSCISVVTTFAQKETFDIITFSPPINWQKEVTENITSYTIVNNTTKNWCRINIVKSTISKGSIEQDFENEWKELIVKNYKPTDTPQINEVQEADGWKIKAGIVKFTFNNSDAIAMLTNMSGFERCASIVATTNSQDYLKDIEAFLASVDLIKPEVVSPQTSEANENENSIIGTWGVSLVVPYRSGTEGTAGSTIKQYTFNFNGTYTFYSKTFRYRYENLILIKENGTYQINGNTLTINPQQSVIQSWSKKDGTDKWGNLLSTKERTLEKITYQFTKDYSSGVQEWNLVLMADKVTQRDGPHSSNTTFSNAWYYSPISSSNLVIELPNGEKIQAGEIKKEPVQQIAINSNSNILGTWGANASDNSSYRINNGVVNYISRQYTFYENGTYMFVSKAYDPLMNDILLGKENGTYQISGNNIKVNPIKSVLEAWSKKDGRDEWGKLLNSKNITLEKVSYQFTKYYLEGNQNYNLVLQAEKVTQRDGPFSFSGTFANAWYYGPISFNNKVIELPK